MSKDLTSLAQEYLALQEKSRKTDRQIARLKEEIISLASEQEIRKIKTSQAQLLIVSQSETRFPQIGEPGRKEVEKIVEKSKQATRVMVFDIISLGNLYDSNKLSMELKERLKPFAKTSKTKKIVVRIL